MKCRYQDNLELIQWLKRYIELQGGPQEQYDAAGRRGKVVIDLPGKKKTGKENIGKKSLMQSYNSLNFKKSGFGCYSTTSGQSSARRSHSPDNLNLTLRTPVRPYKQSSVYEVQRIQSHTERPPLRSIQWEDSNKLSEIRAVFKHTHEDREQLR